jgi:hypothetical protein
MLLRACVSVWLLPTARSCACALVRVGACVIMGTCAMRLSMCLCYFAYVPVTTGCRCARVPGRARMRACVVDLRAWRVARMCVCARAVINAQWCAFATVRTHMFIYRVCLGAHRRIGAHILSCSWALARLCGSDPLVTCHCACATARACVRANACDHGSACVRASASSCTSMPSRARAVDLRAWLS